MGVFSVKRFADWTTRYGFVVLVEHEMRQYLGMSEKQKLSKSQEMISSLAGGTLSALATVPIDVTVSMIQQASKKGQKVSVIEIYREKFRSGGVGATMQLATRGLVARVTHVALTVLMMKNVSSWFYSFLEDIATKK
ncbi:mitochondrial carrier domain-containing protein [Reticulomyxa filosa]|uniref:Mitochondrial carrier domain-containing protein n=1 Tax=Reticulomyxa filosa TaxID=46433 RepID=X6LPB4_RETFI|nr:mitochondrial carrier domain-containing protein [Reticulomyxa filosa]|eukprot:ETO03758.1 mitochondrial carrier domain-containing protein [Reticulomyxa filosa]